MNFDPTPYPLVDALAYWAAVFGVCLAIALFVGITLSLVLLGKTGPAVVWAKIREGFREFSHLSFKRIGALTSLTVKEALRRRALMVFWIFLLLFMFAGWFLQGPDSNSAKPYVVFVLTAVKWLTLPIALLLACWGLPQDIKDRSLHTVVTKPVRRSEVVIGRMLGYTLVSAAVVAIMGAVGYVWILREVPDRLEDQLISRVPVYGSVSFVDRTGAPASRGVNVGDIWDYRSFIEGGTAARAVWTFDNLDVDELKEAGELKLEYSFEIFRSHKGELDRGVLGQFVLINEDEDIRIPYPQTPFEFKEFATGPEEATAVIPEELTYYPEGSDEPATANLFEDVIDDDQLTVAVRVVDPSQYLGAARPDLFIRMPDRSFASGYWKAILGIFLTISLVIILGTTASTFVKGPVATLLTFALLIVGTPRSMDFLDTNLNQFTDEGKVLGGGPVESLYRIVTQMNVQTPLPEGGGTTAIKAIDDLALETMVLLRGVLPDFRPFDMSVYIANGFDVPWNAALLPSIAITLGFVIPCILLGFYSLHLRELEAK